MNKIVFTIALTQTLLLTLGSFNPADGQDESIVRAIPRYSNQVSNRLVQDPVDNATSQDLPSLIQPFRPDEQASPSDQDFQERANDLKVQQQLDGGALIDQLNDPTISSLFEQGKWPRKQISDISLDIREPKNAPQDIASKLVDSQAGRWNSFTPTQKVFAWAAPDIRYQPLYFENVPLERYGQTKGPLVQSVHSTAHFFTSVALLPYHMRHDHPGSCDYPLGFCRPGDIVPCTIQRQLYGQTDR